MHRRSWWEPLKITQGKHTKMNDHCQEWHDIVQENNEQSIVFSIYTAVTKNQLLKILKTGKEENTNKQLKTATS